MIVRVPSNEFAMKVKDGEYINPRDAPDAEDPIEKKSYCTHVCEALPLVCKSFKMKMSDHLLLGGEHVKKISPGFHSPIKPDEETSAEEKKDIVKATPSFGMFSLFKYHLKRGYLNRELKKFDKQNMAKYLEEISEGREFSLINGRRFISLPR